MTEKLYYRDAYTKEFEAVVTGCVKEKDVYAVLLDRTAFYPEGGGQPCDMGSLTALESADAQSGREVARGAARGVRVLDVREDGDLLRHFCDGPLEAGTKVRGRIDWDRRITHMREHSGEHIISGIICREYGLSNIGFHMGRECVTIDFNGLLTEEQIARAVRLANEKVLEDVEILAQYPGREALETLEYRSKKALDGDIRIVTVPGADVCACCGTHVRRTGEIGPIQVTGSEHYKSGIRLTLLVGQKALDDYREKSDNNKRISALLSVKTELTAAAVEKLMQEMNCLKMEYGALKLRMLEEKAEAVEDGARSAVLFEDGLSPVELRKLADRLQERAGFAAAFSGNDRDGYKYVVCSSALDTAAFGKAFNRALNGRGGGKNPMIQGSLSATRTEIEAYLAERGLLS